MVCFLKSLNRSLTSVRAFLHQVLFSFTFHIYTIFTYLTMAPTSATNMQIKWDQLASGKLRDIQELVEKPYPGIKFHIQDDDLGSACLVLSPQSSRSLHLRLQIPGDYPLEPPTVTIQTNICHPNVYLVNVSV